MDKHQTKSELAFISMGSNIEPEWCLPEALERLVHLGSLLRVSNVYQNPAQGPVDQPDFLNAAALLQTDLGASQLRGALRAIERDLGRRRGEVPPGLSAREARYAPRTIDLDLSLLGQQTIRSKDIRLPDPELLTKAHVAIPISELAPDFPHPETHEPLRVIAQRTPGRGRMKMRPDVWREREFASAPSIGAGEDGETHG